MPSDGLTPPFLIEIAVEPKSKAAQEKLSVTLAKLAVEDPSFRVSTDGESGQTILAGTSEDHLSEKVELIKRDGIEANIGAPQVGFRECITRRVEHSYTHKKQTRRADQFAAVTIVVEPNDQDGGYTFESRIIGGGLPEKYIQGVEKGLASVLSSGVVAGFPVVDVKVQLVDGKYHDADSSALAFEIATRACFREALQKAGPVLLEPIMKVEVVTPKECDAAIIRDLKLRRGQIAGLDTRDDAVVIDAAVPLMEMFGYAGSLRQTSDGRATFGMRFDRYAPAPPNVSHDDDPPFPPAIGMRA